MLQDQILALNRIIERESKSSTYKFALLRATVDTINTYRAHFELSGSKYIAPIGFLVESWILYYYPLFEEYNIPQIAGKSKQLSFESSLIDLINHYKTKGGFSTFYNDYTKFRFDASSKQKFNQVFRLIRMTIANMPMKYFGNSMSAAHYSYYQVEKLPNFNSKCQSRFELLLGSGYFTIDEEYFNLLSTLGSLINGTDSIINKWAEYSFKASEKSIKKELILAKLNEAPTNSRQTSISENHFKKIREKSNLYCVWTGKKISDYHLDHLVPYSVMNNNDLWNLLPVSPVVNSTKSDKIPSYEKLHQSKERIFEYWSDLRSSHEILFDSQLKLTLNLNATKGENEFEFLLEKVKNHCDYLINIRGYDVW